MKGWKILGLLAFFALAIVVVIAFTPDGEPKNITSPTPTTPTEVVVEYQIEYGPEQDRKIYQGERALTVSSLGIGENGLPLEYLDPDETRIPFAIGGKHAVLYVPRAAKHARVTGFLKIEDVDAYQLMTVDVHTRYDGVLKVFASPRS
ncbi:MAG: hypothetical protein V1656_01845 [Candidatus Jorgensenbacteria bacterium]